MLHGIECSGLVRGLLYQVLQRGIVVSRAAVHVEHVAFELFVDAHHSGHVVHTHEIALTQVLRVICLLIACEGVVLFLFGQCFLHMSIQLIEVFGAFEVV